MEPNIYPSVFPGFGYPCDECGEFVPTGEDHGVVTTDEAHEDEWLCEDCYTPE